MFRFLRLLLRSPKLLAILVAGIFVGGFFLVASQPTLIIKTVAVTIEISGTDVPKIGIVTITAGEFTWAAWLIHELLKLEITPDQYVLVAELCDPPSDCDKDSVTLDWIDSEEVVTTSRTLHVPSFVGERTVVIQMLDGNTVVSETTFDFELTPF